MTNLIPTVTLIDGRPRVSSLDIAEKFGKRHTNLLRFIKAILADLPEEFRRLNFESTFTNVPGPNGAVRQSPAYSLTRDAFSLVVMGFTGKAALAWKVKYIEAFNAMEAELLKKAKPSPRQRRSRKALPAPEQLALPTPQKDKFEAYIEQVEAFRARTDTEIRRLLGEGLNLVDVYKFGPESIRGFSNIFLNWLYAVAINPVPLITSWQGMDRAIEYSPLYLLKELERKLPGGLTAAQA